MTGPIPDWFPKCFKDLVELDLSFNCLSGGLPRNVHELEYLEEFKVENNFTLGGPLVRRAAAVTIERLWWRGADRAGWVREVVTRLQRVSRSLFRVTARRSRSSLR